MTKYVGCRKLSQNKIKKNDKNLLLVLRKREGREIEYGEVKTRGSKMCEVKL